MSLGHVYIVLKLVGSACLTFGDDRYYEFMCFDVPKVVRSPEYDHVHEDRYIGRLCLDTGRVPDEFGHFPEYREVTGTPRELNVPICALVEIEGSKGTVGRAPKAETELV